MQEKHDATRYGEWLSPIKADLLARSGSVIDSHLVVSGGHLYFSERRPDSKGEVLVRLGLKDLRSQDLAHSVRSRVHEYGGAAFAVGGNGRDGGVLIVDGNSQDLLLLSAGGSICLAKGGSCAFGDMVWDDVGRRFIVVAEISAASANSAESADSDSAEPQNQLWSVGVNGGVRVLARGADFYAAPNVRVGSRQYGGQCAWLEWDHPYMAWDSARLMCADMGCDGGFVNVRRLAGGSSHQSCFQPQYDSHGNLFFICDNEEGFWQLYSLSVDGELSYYPLRVGGEFAECGLPLWQLGMRVYDFLSDARIIMAASVFGQWGLYILDLASRTWHAQTSDFCAFEGLRAKDGVAYFLGAHAQQPSSLVEMDFRNNVPVTRILRHSMPSFIDSGNIAKAQLLSLASEDGERIYGYYYPPTNQAHKTLPPNDNDNDSAGPPLVVKCHGGPSACTHAGFNGKIQFWTSRGFAVFDLNYRGSTGFGRVYRESLYGRWGIADWQDCEYAVQFLAKEGLADSNRMIISGSSAGGYTVLCALTFGNSFHAGCSAYGIGDLEALVSDTHKFESHYLHRLVAPYPQEKREYRRRSPLHHAKQINCPVLFLQGGEDNIVPPNQMFAMLEALRSNGIQGEYRLFADEAHGFRSPNNIIQALHAELEFYGKVFNLQTKK